MTALDFGFLIQWYYWDSIQILELQDRKNRNGLILAISCSLKIKVARRISHRGKVSEVFIPFDQDFTSLIRICGQKSIFHPATAEMKAEGKAS